MLASRPAGFWTFDESVQSRVARNAVTPRPNGRYVDTRLVTGVAGSARRFDGRSAFMSIPTSPAWSQPTTGVLTVEFWMRPDALVFRHEEGSGYVWILGKGEPRRQEWGFRMYGADNSEQRGNRIAFYAYNPRGGEGAGAYFEDTIVPGRWLYVVGELTPVGVRIYCDGVLRQGPPASGTLYANPAYRIRPRSGSAPVRVGTRNFGSFFAGAIDELAIYPHLLSARQVLRHYELALAENPMLSPPGLRPS
ncbi:MAG: LamG-like jellyroll fold domain-containing protein [Gaiellaceae bacterium]